MTTTRARRTRRGGVRWLAAASVVAVISLVSGCSADARDDSRPEKRAFTMHGRLLTVDAESAAMEVVPVGGRQVRVTRLFKGHLVLGAVPPSPGGGTTTVSPCA